MKFVVADLEATLKKYKEEDLYLTEIGAVAYGANFEYLGKFHSYIRPSNKRYIKDVKTKEKVFTNKESMMSSETISVVIKKFTEWLGDDDYILVFWSTSDLYLLIDAYLTRHYDLKWLKNYCDLQSIFNKFINSDDQVSLSNALMYINTEEVGRRHDALSDAYNTSKILHYLLDNSEEIRFNKNPFELISSSLYRKCTSCKEVKWFGYMVRRKDTITSTCKVCKNAKNAIKRINKMSAIE